MRNLRTREILVNNKIHKVSAILAAIILATTGVTLAYADQAENDATWQITGEVVETMDVDNYTYLRVDSGKEKVWAVAPRLELAVGDHVKVPEGALMAGYYSKSLDRTFESIYFVGFVVVDKKAAEGYQHAKPDPVDTADTDVGSIEKIEGGVTVGQVFDDKTDLAGKDITVRGKVVQFTPKVMGTNWLHLRDGTSGAQHQNNLTVTTAAMVNVGDTVVVRGVLTLDKDFGAGYKYDVIVENGSVTTE